MEGRDEEVGEDASHEDTSYIVRYAAPEADEASAPADDGDEEGREDEVIVVAGTPTGGSVAPAVAVGTTAMLAVAAGGWFVHRRRIASRAGAVDSPIR